MIGASRIWPWLASALALLLALQTQRLAKVETSHSREAVAQAQQAQAATEKKAQAVVEHGAAQHENTHDYTQEMARLEAGRTADAARMQACSTTSGARLPATPSLPVTPLPAEISQISTSDSQPLLQRARAWLGSLSDWSKSETLR